MLEEDSTLRSVLIVDGDLGSAEALAAALEPLGYASCCVDTAERAVAALREPPGNGAGLPVALIDAALGGGNRGLDLVPRLQAYDPELLCVLMSAELDVPTALTALRRGVFDHFDKGAGAPVLAAVLDRCFDRVALLRERDAEHRALRLAKDHAEAASRGKSGFLATMSHELRTPLNAIIGFSEMMMRQVLGPLGNEQYGTYIADIHESGTHLLQIINDILDLSKAEAGKLELHEELFDLRDTIRSVRQLIGTRIREGGLTDSVEIAADLPLLRADERKTKQLLLNLVTNAVKFTPPGGHVGILARFEPDSGLTLSVHDTGIGIAPEDLDRVLEPFEQVDSSFSRLNPGTGLGLPLVKAIAELHGGRLELNSELGAGTRVNVAFPAWRTVAETAVAASRSAA